MALGTFANGITEFLMMGILVNLAKDLSVSVGEAGHLNSAYAIGVYVGAPAALIAIGNLCAALSPSLPHGAYFGVGAIMARKLATSGKEVSAVSIMIAGMTVATLGSVPLGTFITNTLS